MVLLLALDLWILPNHYKKDEKKTETKTTTVETTNPDDATKTDDTTKTADATGRLLFLADDGTYELEDISEWIEFISRTNMYRCMHGSPPLKWN